MTLKEVLEKGRGNKEILFKRSDDYNLRYNYERGLFDIAYGGEDDFDLYDLNLEDITSSDWVIIQIISKLVEIPKQKYWRWIFRKNNTDYWRATQSYVNENGMRTDGRLYKDGWASFEKMKIESSVKAL